MPRDVARPIGRSTDASTDRSRIPDAAPISRSARDQLLGDEFRRQTLIAPESLAWLSLHETLEVAHADASSVLAALVPPHAVKAAHRGAMAVFLAGWTFLDQLYATCYPMS